MKYDINQVRRTWLPYCIDEMEPGQWIFRNREYRPLGVCASDGPFLPFEEYQRYRINMTPELLKRISYPKRGGDMGTSVQTSQDGLRAVYLYNDGCTPFCGSAADTRAYFKRLEALQKAILK